MTESFRPPFTGDMTLANARVTLRDLADVGETCPVCAQNVKVYNRPINVAMARALVLMYENAQRNWVHFPTLIAEDGALAAKLGGQHGKLQYWDLIEEERVVRALDGGRAGFWRVTAHGEQWLAGATEIPKYARIYNGRCLSLHGDLVTIHDALHQRFDLRPLMSAAPLAPGDAAHLFDVPPAADEAA